MKLCSHCRVYHLITSKRKYLNYNNHSIVIFVYQILSLVLVLNEQNSYITQSRYSTIHFIFNIYLK